jgi:imidazolonepropionase-like amidohydrolase
MNNISSKNKILELKNGRFVDVEKGRYYDIGTSVFIKDGRILSVSGNESKGNIISNQTVDLQNKTVIPGLFNTHCHVQIMTFVSFKDNDRELQINRMLEDCLNHGVTNIRDTLTDDLRVNASLNDRVISGTLLGPRIHQSVHVAPIGGTYSARQNMGYRLIQAASQRKFIKYDDNNSGVIVFPIEAGEMAVRDAVDKAIDIRGAKYIKFCDQKEKGGSYKPGASVISQNQLSAAVDQARKRGVVTTIHNVSVEGFRKALKAGVTSIAHIPQDTELCDSDIKEFIDSGIMLEPTLTVPYYYSWNIPGRRGFNHPELLRLTEFRKESFNKNIEQFWVPSCHKSLKSQREMIEKNKLKVFGLIDMGAIYEYFSGLITEGSGNIRKLYNAGAVNQIACGNDACVAPSSLAAVGFELEMLDFYLNNENNSKCLSGLEALRIATINSARSMGLDRDYGSIETGKIADLAVVNGDPLYDFKVIGSKVEALFMDGNVKVNNCGLRALAPV